MEQLFGFPEFYPRNSARESRAVFRAWSRGVSKQNFVFKATKVWNKLIGHALERTEPEISGLIIPGSARNSDLSDSIAFVKGKIKIYIQNSQKLGHIYLW